MKLSNMAKNRLARYEAKNKLRNLVKLQIRVPATRKDEVLAIAARMRQEGNATIECLLSIAAGMFFISAPWVFAFFYY